jgi:hypothetical protein
VLKLYPSAISITTGLLTTLAVNSLALAASPSAFSQATGSEAPAPWRYVALPARYAKPSTLIDITEFEGEKVLRLHAKKSWGSLVHPWTGKAETVSFKWLLVDGGFIHDKRSQPASLANKATEDAALKVCLSFDMPADRIPAAERSLFKLAQFFSKDKLPTATLCYVWVQVEATGSIHPSPTTARVRYMVLNSSQGAKVWATHTRNISADFLKAFGNEIDTTPPVTAIIVGADSDNTENTSLGFIGDIMVQP